MLESIFYVREKLLSVGSIHVLLCSCELVACLSADAVSGIVNRRRRAEAFAYVQVRLGHFLARIKKTATLEFDAIGC